DNSTYVINDILTFRWDAQADNGSTTEIVSATFDFSPFDGGSAVAATETFLGSGIWEASYTIAAPGTPIDASTLKVSVTATDDAGNDDTMQDDQNIKMDNVIPTITFANISIEDISSGNGGEFITGDDVIAHWDNTASTGDNNPDIATVSFDFSQFEGPASTAGTNNSDDWEATHTVTAGSLEAVNRNVTVTIEDDAGYQVILASVDNEEIDNRLPIISSITSDANSGGTLIVGNTITFTLTPDKDEIGATVNGSYNGISLTWSDASGGLGQYFTATYTIMDGETDQKSSASQITGVTMDDAPGNTSASADGADVVKLIDANLPEIVSVSNLNGNTQMIVGGPYSANINIELDTDTDPYTLISGDIANGNALFTLSRVDDDTYTIQFNISDNGTDYLGSDNVPVNSLQIQDDAGNLSAIFSGNVTANANDAIFANLPDITTVTMPKTLPAGPSACVEEEITIDGDNFLPNGVTTVVVKFGGLTINTFTTKTDIQLVFEVPASGLLPLSENPIVETVPGQTQHGTQVHLNPLPAGMPDITNTTDPEKFCQGSSVTLNAAGTLGTNEIYVWFQDSEFPESSTGSSRIVSVEATFDLAIKNTVTQCYTTASDWQTIDTDEIVPSTVVATAVEQLICLEGSTTIDLMGSSVTGGELDNLGVWSGGQGTFSDNTPSENPYTDNGDITYTPAPADFFSQTITLTLSNNGNPPCPAVTDDVIIEFVSEATAQITEYPTATCQEDQIDLTGILGSTDEGTWSWQGPGSAQGTFNGSLGSLATNYVVDMNSNPEDLTISYTLSPEDITAGTVTLRFTPALGTCGSTANFDQVSILIYSVPATGAILGDDEVCAGTENELYEIDGSPPASYSYIWTIPAEMGTKIVGGMTSSIMINYVTDAVDSIITAQVIDNNGCLGTIDTLAITVNTIPNVIIGNSITNYSSEADPIDLVASKWDEGTSSFIDVTGSDVENVLFIGPGVSYILVDQKYLFAPANAGLTTGTPHSIIMTYTNPASGCVSPTDTLKVFVFDPNNTIVNLDPEYCVNDGVSLPIALRTETNPIIPPAQGNNVIYDYGDYYYYSAVYYPTYCPSCWPYGVWDGKLLYVEEISWVGWQGPNLVPSTGGLGSVQFDPSAGAGSKTITWQYQRTYRYALQECTSRNYLTYPYECYSYEDISLATAPPNYNYSSGPYNYVLTQETANVYAIPEPPSIVDTDDGLIDNSLNYCIGSSVDSVFISNPASSDKHKWYDASSGGSVVFSTESANSFKAHPDELGINPLSPDNYTYYLTTLSNFSMDFAGCESSTRQQVTVNVYDTPSQPVLSPFGNAYCDMDFLPSISVSSPLGGEVYKWYDDDGTGDKNSVLYNNVNTFTPGFNTVSLGNDTLFFVTKTTNQVGLFEGCESDTTTIKISVSPIPATPTADPVADYCDGTAPVTLTVTPNGNTFRWYNAVDLGQPSGTPFVGTSFNTGVTSIFNPSSDTTFYLTQTADGCESQYESVSFKVYDIPSEPIVTTIPDYCDGDAIANLSILNPVFEETYKWYTAGDVFSFEGSSYASGITTVGKVASDTTVKVTKTVNGCESPKKNVIFYIYNIPSAPAFTPVDPYCIGESIQPLSVTGTDVIWYSDTLNSIVATGTSFITGLSAGSAYDTAYYVTQTVNGCESDPEPVSILVNSLPTVLFTGLGNAYCADFATLVNLTGAPAGAGGIFTGDGVTDIGLGLGRFSVLDAIASDPEPTTVSNHEVKFIYTDENGCTDSTSQIVQVNPLPRPDIQNVSDGQEFCLNDEDYLMFDGTVSISPLIRNDFSTFKAGAIGSFYQPDLVGIDSIDYEVEDQNGCINTITKWVKVNPLPQPDFELSTFCNAFAVDLIDKTTISEGSISSWEWEFGDGSISVEQSPSHLFADPQQYNVSLQTTSAKGCVNSVIELITIGEQPGLNFTWEGVCEGAPTTFTATKSSPTAVISSWSWDFDDNSAVADIQNASYQFTNSGGFNVTLSATTQQQCTETKTWRVVILPTLDLTDNYFEDFESSTNTWIAEDIRPGKSGLDDFWSWEVNTTASDISVPNNGMNFWASTNNVGGYFNNEKSSINSPCLSFTNFTKPMVSFDIWRETENGNDGVTFQYSTDGGANWYIVGDEFTGTNWFNARGIIGITGLDAAGNSNGWTGSDTSWVNARYALDDLKGQASVRFRFALGSNDTNFGDYDGFAFDNIYIGDRNRTVLIEQFSNLLEENQGVQEEYIRDLVADNPEYITVNYHTDFPDQDVFNAENSTDPGARTIYYGVSTVHKAILDGTATDDAPFNSGWSELKGTQRLLELSPFDINLQALTSAEGTVSFRGTITYIRDSAFSYSLKVYAAVLEDVSEIDGNTSYSVLRKLLPDPAGYAIEKQWENGTSEQLELSVGINDFTNVDNGNIRIIVFIQDEVTKQVYQAAGLSTSGVQSSLTGLEDLPGTGNIVMYPVPASNILYVGFRKELTEKCDWTIVSQQGVVINAGYFAPGYKRYEMDVSLMPNGVYEMVLDDNKSLHHAGKILIIH
ncbi:MAG TPA: PKD domain-containing protein, partial [Cyclobacteriaceae bacterium]|nr:PKD domain-containing protein [Cyclobacteriaceae bacterium]